MQSRSRALDTNQYFGYVYTVSGGVEEILGHKSTKVKELLCEDFYKKQRRLDGTGLPPTDALITSHFRDPLCMNRNTLTFRFVNHPVENDGFTSVAGFDSVRPARGTVARVNENRDLALELLAATNPWRYEFSIPVAIKELADMGALFKLAAKTFAGFAGGAYLNYKFGWQQFVRDLKTLGDITTAIERRIKELKSLERRGGLRRKVHLRSKSSDYLNTNSLLQSAWGVTIRAEVRGRYQCQTHGTVRWRFSPGYDQDLDKLQTFNSAVRKVFDLEALDSQTVWNLIPFSWLADYFVNMSAYLGAHAGGGTIEPYDICIVRKCKSRFRQQVFQKPTTITLSGGGRYGRDLYERDVVTLSSLAFPSVGLLNRHQLLIIAALLASFKR